MLALPSPDPEGENFLELPVSPWRTVLQVAEEFSDSEVKTSSPLRSCGTNDNTSVLAAETARPIIIKYM
jgi:hypothetical protein